MSVRLTLFFYTFLPEKTTTWKCPLYPKIKPTKSSITAKMEEASGSGKR
jgi:hypothetical protein